MKKMMLIFATGMLAMVILAAIWMFQETTVRASQSPNGQYLLVVLKGNWESILPVMPGQGSDAKCHVELRDRESGRRLVRKEVAMLQDVQQIQWEHDKVWINPRFAIPYDGSDLGNRQPWNPRESPPCPP